MIAWLLISFFVLLFLGVPMVIFGGGLMLKSIF